MNEKNRTNPSESGTGVPPVSPTGVSPVSSGGASPPPPPQPPADSSLPSDDLDSLLRQWHSVNATRAVAGRDRLLAALAREPGAPAPSATSPQSVPQPELKFTPAPLPSLLSLEPDADPAVRADRRAHAPHPRAPSLILRRIVMNRYSPAAAALILLAVLLPFFLPHNSLIPGGGPKIVLAGDTIMCPDGGRLDAHDDDGNLLGPCELKHTDVVADVSGFLTRVTVKQKYHNPHPDKIEAVYTFPLSNHAAVDRMTMTIGDRIIVGQVKEREQARQIYEQAKAAGYHASLLEQERPNIFTQSIANIEPGADIDIEISYVEILQQSGGQYSFDFPTVVGPRYIPGSPTGTLADPVLPGQPGDFVPEYVHPLRRGLVLLAPATLSGLQPGDTSRGAISAYQLSDSLRRATPIRAIAQPVASVWYNFKVGYTDGSDEMGTLFTDGTGVLNAGNFGARWFYCPPARLSPVPAPPVPGVEPGGGFSADTNKVPDASRITPMPVRPPTRAGHDISITVNIDTGGPAILDLQAPLHQIVQRPGAAQGDDLSPATARTTVMLRSAGDIPNKDFVLKWKQTAAQVEPTVFTHTGNAGQGSFFSVTLLPPERVDDTMAVPRELIFVLDTSGSMNGLPIERAKSVIAAAIDAMRSFDTFNLITFAGDTQVLWNRPRPATQANRQEAQQFLTSRTSSGGTEMMKAINAALEQRDWRQSVDNAPPAITAEQLANLPADGREVRVLVPSARFSKVGDDDRLSTSAAYRIATSFGTDIVVRARNTMWAIKSDSLTLTGRWNTDQGNRFFDLTAIDAGGGPPDVVPLRVVMFLTDGYVGNDMGIIDAIRKHRGTTRVFSFGIGDAVNRYLLDGMARAGGGEVEYVFLKEQGLPGSQSHEQPRAAATPQSDIDDIVSRFNARIRTPVLTNISVQFSPNIQAENVMTALGGGTGGGGVSDLSNIPDLFDVNPLTIVGRYSSPAQGTITISGNTAAGPWRKTINLTLPAHEPAHDTVATLWARTKVESIMNSNLSDAQRGVIGADAHNQIVSLGEQFGLLTQYTSFVAVDRLRVTVGNRSRLIHIPIELPQGTNFRGFFGGPDGERDRDGKGDAGEDLGMNHLDVPQIDLQGLLQSSQSGGGGGAGRSPFKDSLVLGRDAGTSGKPLDRVFLIQDGAAPINPPPPPSPPPPSIDELTRLATAPGADASGAPAESQPRFKSGTGFANEREELARRRGTGSKSDDKEKKAEVSSEKEQATGPIRANKPIATPAGEERKDAGGASGRVPATPAAPEPSPPAKPELEKSTPPAPVDASESKVVDQAFRALRERNDELSLALARQYRSTSAADELSRIPIADGYFKQRESGYPLAANSDIRTSHGAGGAATAPASGFVLPQQVIRYTAWLVKENKLDDARGIAVLLADAAPTYTPGLDMRDALTDDKLSEPERNLKVAQLDAKADDDLKALARRAKLFHRLDPDLLPLALADPAAPASTIPSIAGATITPDGILLTILVQEAGKNTLQALQSAGLTIEHSDTKLNIVVGTAAFSHIADVALVEGVRKVEPTRD